MARLHLCADKFKTIGHGPLVDTHNTCTNAQYCIKVKLKVCGVLLEHKKMNISTKNLNQ
jgi:hypothetical protein